MEALQLLSRNEMKMIKGGIGGNVHCNISGNQFSCDGSLLDCLDACDGMADGMGGECNGCAQFPQST